LRSVLERYSAASLPPIPPNPEKARYGDVLLRRVETLFDGIEQIGNAVRSSKPLAMESVGQMFGFLLYASKYTTKDEGSTLFIPKFADKGYVATKLGHHNKESAA
ncbi:Beta-galactosidase 8-like protein, partial [Drosera capensis]